MSFGSQQTRTSGFGQDVEGDHGDMPQLDPPAQYTNPLPSAAARESTTVQPVYTNPLQSAPARPSTVQPPREGDSDAPSGILPANEFFKSNAFRAFAEANYAGDDYKTSRLTTNNIGEAKSLPIYQMMLAGNYNDFEELKKYEVEDNDVHPDFTSFIITFARSMNQAAGRTQTGGNMGRNSNLSNMTREMREFYRAHTRSSNNQMGGGVDQWESESSQGYDMDSIRNSLPLLPDEKGRSVWLRQTDGSIVPLTNDRVNRNVFRELYNNCSSGVNSCQNIVPFPSTTKQEWNAVPFPSTAKQEWNLSPRSIVDQVLRSSCQTSSSKPKQSDGPNTFDGEFWDMNYNRWVRDGTGKLFRVSSDGKTVIPCDDDQFLQADCPLGTSGNRELGTNGNREQCSNFLACIFNNPKNFRQCIEDYKDSNIFEIANNDLNINPGVAAKIIDIFEVPTPSRYNPMYGKHIIEPSYNEWVQTVGRTLPESVQKYVQTVCNFLRNNPAILNEDIKGTVPGQQLQTLPQEFGFYTKLGKKYYQNPLPNTVQGLSYGSEFLLRSAKAIPFAVQPPNIDALSQFPATFNSVGYMAPGPGFVMSGGGGGVMGAQYGGQIPSVIGNLKQKLIRLFEDLQKYNIVISRADREKIIKKIGDLEKEEQKINEFIKTLKIILELERFVKSLCPEKSKFSCNENTSGNQQTNNVRTLDFRQFKNPENLELLNFLRRNIGDYESSIYNSVSGLNEGTNNILHSYNDLIKTLTISNQNPQKNSNDDLVRVLQQALQQQQQQQPAQQAAQAQNPRDFVELAGGARRQNRYQRY
jgi:hypothetical protein